MSEADNTNLESDPRFPSGPWTGYFRYRQRSRRDLMEMRLTFADGILKGEGRDIVGPFSMRGRYSVADGTCHWTKQYLGRHDVFYRGYNEGKGIWGVWEILPPTGSDRGGFHIWPEGMNVDDPEALHAEADVDVEVEATLETRIPQPAPR